MDNFEILKHYTIPSDVLMDMLSTYRLLGMNLEYEEKIKDQAKYLRNEVIEKDTFFLANLIGVDITDNRLRLLITKNSLPKNKEEQMVVGIKKVVNMIYVTYLRRRENPVQHPAGRSGTADRLAQHRKRPGGDQNAAVATICRAVQPLQTD